MLRLILSIPKNIKIIQFHDAPAKDYYSINVYICAIKSKYRTWLCQLHGKSVIITIRGMINNCIFISLYDNQYHHPHCNVFCYIDMVIFMPFPVLNLIGYIHFQIL